MDAELGQCKQNKPVPLTTGLVKEMTRSSENTRLRALVIDDDEDIREVISDVLRMMDFEVFSAESGTDGMAVIDEQEVLDIIIVDYRLPNQTGGELIRQMRQRKPSLNQVPTLLLSADRDLNAKASEYGISACLAKPPDLGALMTQVKNLVK